MGVAFQVIQQVLTVEAHSPGEAAFQVGPADSSRAPLGPASVSG